jgi:hypothetical protein
MPGEIRFGAKEAEFDEGTGEVFQWVTVEQQHGRAFEIAGVSEFQFLEQSGIGFGKG